MATTKEYIQFVLEQLDGIDDVTCKKMFGEYMVYVQEKPVLIVCDNCPMVKKCRSLPRSCGTHRTACLMRARRCIISWILKTAS